jgi:methylornithine synthase
VFFYGFIYFSTHCRNDCRFCYYRRSNTVTTRYRRSVSDVVQAARILADSGVHLIDLTAGEELSPQVGPGGDYDGLVERVARVGQATGLPIMVSPGVVPDKILGRLQRAGAVWYACYQETYRLELFRRLRVGQSFERRLHAKRRARQLGLLVEDGILCGVGETMEDTAEAVRSMGRLGASQMRAMTFVPRAGTPMQHHPAPAALRELRAIAVMRCAFPDRCIPASLDVAGLAGLGDRLAAGANVVTSIVPPGRGLTGVAQSSLDISEARRSVESIRAAMAPLGLRPGSRKDYADWVAGRKTRSTPTVLCELAPC